MLLPLVVAIPDSPFATPGTPLLARGPLSSPIILCAGEGFCRSTLEGFTVPRAISSPVADNNWVSSCGLTARPAIVASESVAAPESACPLSGASCSDVLVRISRNEINDGLAGAGESKAKLEVVAVDAIRTPKALHVARHGHACSTPAPATDNYSFQAASECTA